MEDEWTADANEALTVSLVKPTPAGVDKLESFNPKFTYPIFEEERIFGYKGLKINLQYDARDLRPHLSVTSSKKFSAVGEVEALDVKEVLKEYLPGVAFQTRQEYARALNDVPDPWQPPGTLVKTVEKNGEVYEIWQGSLADPSVKQLVKRIQIAVLFYIEGGSYIGVDAEGNEDPEYSLARWTVFFIYKKQADIEAVDRPQYVFQGFSTVYDFWMFEQPTPPPSPGKEETAIQPKSKETWQLPHGDFSLKDVPRRSRISQFVILPPFQGKGVGALLYDTIFDLQKKDDFVKEITVEDPNEDFDLLRDLCDMKYLRKNVPEFVALQVKADDVLIPEKGGILHNNTQISSSAGTSSASSSGIGIVNVAALEQMRLKAKIAPRQFSRLVEMHLMSKLPATVRPTADSASAPAAVTPASKADKQAYTLWRLLLKQRLYRRNIQLLAEFEISERIIKLNETVDNVEWEYARILERLEPKPVLTNGKRKLNGDVGEIDGEEGPSSKKARVEDE